MLQIQTTNLPQDQQQRLHPDFLANEQAYLHMRDSLLVPYQGQWVAVEGGKVIVAGTGGLGGNDGNSEAFLDCPAAKRNPGLKGTPFTDFGFPGATFKLKHGKYSFSKSFSVKTLFSSSVSARYNAILKVTPQVG